MLFQQIHSICSVCFDEREELYNWYHIGARWRIYCQSETNARGAINVSDIMISILTRRNVDITNRDQIPQQLVDSTHKWLKKYF